MGREGSIPGILISLRRTICSAAVGTKAISRILSEGGAYIVPDLRKKVPLGEDILLVVKLRVLLDQIKCRGAWRKSRGMGVAFDTSDPGYSKLKALLAARCFS